MTEPNTPTSQRVKRSPRSARPSSLQSRRPPPPSPGTVGKPALKPEASTSQGTGTGGLSPKSLSQRHDDLEKIRQEMLRLSVEIKRLSELYAIERSKYDTIRKSIEPTYKPVYQTKKSEKAGKVPPPPTQPSQDR
jgi:hypothetical protein